VQFLQVENHLTDVGSISEMPEGTSEPPPKVAVSQGRSQGGRGLAPPDTPATPIDKVLITLLITAL
jgi:hypothetical protein